MAGMDISPTGINRTREVCAARQLEVDVCVSDMTTIPWPEHRFDGVFSIAAIHHQLRADLSRSLAEVWRVLKPGGLFLADFPHVATLTYQQARQWVNTGQLVEVEPNTFVDVQVNFEEDDLYLPHHFCDETDLRDLLRPFDILKLQADLCDAVLDGTAGLLGKWVVWARKPVNS